MQKREYLIIFYAICLRFDKEWNWRLMKIICENVSSIAFAGKRIVLANLYWHLVQCIDANHSNLRREEVAISNKSYFRYGLIRLKYFLRYGKTSISFRDFAERFGKNLHKSKSSINRKHITLALQAYYRFFMADTKENTKIDLSFASPLASQPYWSWISFIFYQSSCFSSALALLISILLIYTFREG